jgi:catechol 2,3-dioxygenase-like lactoylglutathione lyase family enzyme
MQLLGLRTVIYPAADLSASKAWFTNLLGTPPYFDQPFYVGFNVGGYELGIDPDAPLSDGPVAHWGVPDAATALTDLLSAGATARSPVREVGDGIRVASVLEPARSILAIIENPHFAPTPAPASPGPGR